MRGLPWVKVKVRLASPASTAPLKTTSMRWPRSATSALLGLNSSMALLSPLASRYSLKSSGEWIGVPVEPELPPDEPRLPELPVALPIVPSVPPVLLVELEPVEVAVDVVPAEVVVEVDEVEVVPVVPLPSVPPLLVVEVLVVEVLTVELLVVVLPVVELPVVEEVAVEREPLPVVLPTVVLTVPVEAPLVVPSVIPSRGRQRPAVQSSLRPQATQAEPSTPQAAAEGVVQRPLASQQPRQSPGSQAEPGCTSASQPAMASSEQARSTTLRGSHIERPSGRAPMLGALRIHVTPTTSPPAGRLRYLRRPMPHLVRIDGVRIQGAPPVALLVALEGSELKGQRLELGAAEALASLQAERPGVWTVDATLAHACPGTPSRTATSEEKRTVAVLAFALALGGEGMRRPRPLWGAWLLAAARAWQRTPWSRAEVPDFLTVRFEHAPLLPRLLGWLDPAAGAGLALEPPTAAAEGAGARRLACRFVALDDEEFAFAGPALGAAFGLSHFPLPLRLEAGRPDALPDAAELAELIAVLELAALWPDEESGSCAVAGWQRAARGEAAPAV